MSVNRTLVTVVAVIVVVAALLVIVGNVASERTNPPVTFTVNWDSPAVEELARGACYDCHSYETRWPWYAHVAPASFLLSGHVTEGRAALNFSTGERLDADKMIEMIEDGRMPKAPYPLMHPEANLSDAQKAQLIAGIQATFGDESAEVDEMETAEPDEDAEEAPEAPATTPEASG